MREKRKMNKVYEINFIFLELKLFFMNILKQKNKIIFHGRMDITIHLIITTASGSDKNGSMPQERDNRVKEK